MNIDAIVERACERIPGLVRGAFVFLPEGFLLGATRGAMMFDLEPLIRSTTRCFAGHATPVIGSRSMSSFVEHAFISDDQFVVVQAGRRDTRIALAVVTTREYNVAFVLSATRLVLGELETAIDLAAWGL